MSNDIGRMNSSGLAKPGRAEEIEVAEDAAPHREEIA